MTKFRPHGETSVEVRDRLFVLRPKSDLNEEEMQRLVRDIKQARQDFGDQPWGILIVVGATVMLTSGAEQIGRLEFPELVAAGLRAFAVAIPRSRERPLIEAQVERVVAGSPHPVRVFDTEAEAATWLAASLGAR